MFIGLFSYVHRSLFIMSYIHRSLFMRTWFSFHIHNTFAVEVCAFISACLCSWVRAEALVPCLGVTLQHTAITPQHTATHCSTLQCNALQCTATHCNVLQRTETQCNALQRTATRCNALQRTAAHCNVLQRTVTLYNAL